ncbi:PQQ-dependent sugar dehydrogenase [Pseudonocardia sp. CA-107938]|uniref:PQQ-dependent sugar dehydrogenase n=1 Tax=Pseudonocardia sp. CA-107938 TaxID=3240021 RepID=UPI003D8ABA33
MRLSNGRSLRIVALTAAAAAGLAACGGGGAPGTPLPAGNQPPVTAEASASDLVQAKLAVPAGMTEGAFEAERTVLIPKGWSMAVFARTPSARLAVWTPDGKMLVSRPKEGHVDVLTPNGSGPADSATLLKGLNQPHGLAFDGATLYVAESSRINAYDYADGRATNRRTVVDGLPDEKSADLHGQYAHALKSVAVGPDHAIYYSIGSTGNISEEDRSASPERAAIFRVPPGGGAPEVFARGVRNGTGLAVAPDGTVWTAVNHRDNIQFPYDTPFGEEQGSQRGKVLDAYVADHPAEQLAKLTPGRDLGWPYCNSDQDVQPGVAGTAYDYSEPKYVKDQELNPDGSKLDCSKLAPVEQSMGAHSAPLGLNFATLPAPYGAGALVGVHGSWNRQPPRAPEVSFFKYENGKMSGQKTLVGGFQGPDGKRWGRPVSATVGPDGAIYITDDSAPAVYRLAPPGK